MLDYKEFNTFIKKKKLEEFEEDIKKELEQLLKKTLEEKTKEIKNKKRIVANDNNKEHIPALEVFSKEQINQFPSWVKENIETAVVIGNSQKVIQISNGKKYHINNKLNDLNGGEWTFFLNSVVNTRYTTGGEEGYAHHIRKIHPSPKPPQLMKQIIEFFTKENEIVFDYFMGVGGSLLGSSLSNRRAIGIDLSDKFINAYKEANEYLNLKEQITIQADSIEFLKQNQLQQYLNNEELSLILIDPPYGDMLSRPKTGEAVKKGGDTSATPFTDSELDLGNMTWDNFLKVFHESIINAMKHLKSKGHIVIFIKDLQPKDKELNLLHADIIRDLNIIDNLKYLGTKIWADQSVNLYPYGYPFSYVSNQIHQYIMIFRKD
ncbi:DNA methyltransferase [Aliarcobacter butzleri]|uniref:DNA methyltransferase n=1 Tax=Aliarcobacter butzleri TaxID=28197 RepID=UPI003B21E162